MKQIFSAVFIFWALPALSQVPTNGLAGYYSFNGNANDGSGNNYHGTVFGATLTTDRFGNPNYAYYFDGTDDYIELSTHVSAFSNNANAKSISFWVKTNYDNPSGNTNNCSTVFSVSNTDAGTTDASIIYVGNHTTSTLTNELISMFSRKDASDYYSAGYTTNNRSLLIDNSWHHIVCDFNNSSTLLYLDGNLLAMSCNFGTNNGHFGNQTDATIVFFGTRWWNGAKGSFMNGDLDDFRFYNRSLTSTEVIQLYNEQNPALSVNEQLNSTYVTLYPNPVSDIVTISWDKTMNAEMEISILDINGKMVRTEIISTNESSVPLDVQNLDRGIYFIRMGDSKHSVTKKLMIN